MDRRTFILSSGAATGLAQLPSLSFAQAGKSLLRWVPETDLALLDPMFTTATITACHALQVFDTLYGLDENYQPQLQMVGSQTLENNDLTWKLTLRDGLKFHDGAAVTAKASSALENAIRLGKPCLASSLSSRPSTTKPSKLP